MKVIYDFLQLGEIPFSNVAKSRAVRVWTPRRGWVRQTNPVRRKEPLLNDPFRVSDLNVFIPELAMNYRRFGRWLREHKAMLKCGDGLLVVFVRDVTMDWIQFGILHDSRRWKAEQVSVRPGTGEGGATVPAAFAGTWDAIQKRYVDTRPRPVLPVSIR